MPRKSFQHAKPRAVFADERRRLIGSNTLICNGLEKLADPQSAGVTRCTLSRQGMISSDHLVAVCNIGSRAKKQSTIIRKARQEEIRVARHDLHVLRSYPICLTHHLVII